MSNIRNPGIKLQYPERERAEMFLGREGVPFRRAFVGITEPLEAYYIERPCAYFTVLELVLEGRGQIFVSGKWQTVSAGEMYILRQGEDHRYRSDPKEPWRKIWINYTSDYLPSMLDAYGLSSGIYPAETARPVFEELLEAALKGTYRSSVHHRIANCVHRILYAAALDRDRNRTEEDRTEGDRIKEALDGAVFTKLNLDGLAAKLHMSKSNLIRVFRKQEGVTPYEYLLSRKMLAGKLLLADTAMTVREIADRLCIGDEHYFSTLFLKKVGMRPKEYRRSKREQRLLVRNRETEEK
ncbi:MAG: helix-turn-helix domain-containing protein [Clostridia bacterium]|nr:helix-turn-helix domain-containing protein [Clostridia bacterium]